MEINFIGHSSFKIRGKNVTIICDPFDKESVGFSYPKTEADIVTISHEHQDHKGGLSQIEGNPFVIEGPGEYEIKDVSIFGVPAFHDNSNGQERGKNTIYTYEVEGLRLCHLGDLGHKLSSSTLEELNGVDILFLPVGGNYTLDPKLASEVASQIEPKVTIPMHYQEEGMKPESFAKLAPVTAFLKEIGEQVAPVPKLVITRDKMPEERQIVVLERRG
ncbi:MAG: MBL fold metallo-hydrolase [Candidatus Curtissbacteria bacterium]|nr:MBL fold metallo-hydrolase [Candidatus Curtissbacteria bacterium]